VAAVSASNSPTELRADLGILFHDSIATASGPKRSVRFSMAATIAAARKRTALTRGSSSIDGARTASDVRTLQLRTSEMVLELNRQGMTVLVVEHDMAFVRQIARMLTVLHFGRTFARGTIDDIIAHEGVQEIYLGKAQDAQ
jgi:ABC-type hemin transport system ATPase subunit